MGIHGLQVGVAAVLLSGCGEAPFDYTGTWSGRRSLDLPNADRYVKATLEKVTLTVKDGRFEMVQAGAPTGGSVSLLGEKARLYTETYMDRPLAEAGADAQKMHEPIDLVPQKDGTLLLVDPRAIDGNPVRLARSQDGHSP